MRYRCALVAAALFLAGGSGCSSEDPCGSGDVQTSYTLTASGISVEITTAPYRLTVRDAGGREVLSTAAGADGYSSVAWTTGRLAVHLHDPADRAAPCVTVTHTLRASPPPMKASSASASASTAPTSAARTSSRGRRRADLAPARARRLHLTIPSRRASS